MGTHVPVQPSCGQNCWNIGPGSCVMRPVSLTFSVRSGARACTKENIPNAVVPYGLMSTMPLGTWNCTAPPEGLRRRDVDLDFTETQLIKKKKKKGTHVVTSTPRWARGWREREPRYGSQVENGGFIANPRLRTKDFNYPCEGSHDETGETPIWHDSNHK